MKATNCLKIEAGRYGTNANEAGGAALAVLTSMIVGHLQPLTPQLSPPPQRFAERQICRRACGETSPYLLSAYRLRIRAVNRTHPPIRQPHRDALQVSRPGCGIRTCWTAGSGLRSDYAASAHWWQSLAQPCQLQRPPLWVTANPVALNAV